VVDDVFGIPPGSDEDDGFSGICTRRL
jgi:hypothetical protein